MTMDNLPLHPQARADFQALFAEEQRMVFQELSTWWGKPRNQWPEARLVPSKLENGMYVFWVNDRLGVKMQWQNEQNAQIVDILHKEALFATSSKRTNPKLRKLKRDLIFGGCAWGAGILGIIGWLVSAEWKTHGPVFPIWGEVAMFLGLMSILVGTFMIIVSVLWYLISGVRRRP
jgi:hypothetical protein